MGSGGRLEIKKPAGQASFCGTRSQFVRFNMAMSSRSAPDTEERSKKDKIEQVVADLYCPDLETMGGEEFVDQVSGGDEADPQHETNTRTHEQTHAAGFVRDVVDNESHGQRFDKRGEHCEAPHDRHIGSARRVSFFFADAFPPDGEEGLGVEPNRTGDHADDDTDQNCKPIN
jgi:hypothetical protein